MNKILFITQDLAVGGGTSSLSALYNAVKDNYDISVFLLADEGEAEVSYKDALIYSNKITDLYYRNYRGTCGVKRCFSVIIKSAFKILSFIGFNVDKYLVHSNNRKFKGYDSVISFGEGVATSFCRYIDIHPRCAWIHFEVSKCPYSDWFLSLYDNFDHIITVSDIIATRLSEIYPTLAPKICGIHNIIDEERIKSLSHESFPEIFPDGKFNIISVGRVSPVKRFSRIPEIASVIKNKGFEIKWRILGPESDAEEQNDLLSNIDKYDVRDIVEYYGNRTNPYPYIKHSDLLIILSSTEACPMVITEARALDVPVIATDFATAAEFIENGKDGIICSIEEIPCAISKLLNDRHLYDQIVTSSRLRGNDTSDVLNKFNTIAQ